MLGLAPVIELLAQARGDLGMDLVGANRRVEALADGEHDLELVEVSLERRGHVRVLQLGGDLAAIRQDGVMDLASTGGSDWLVRTAGDPYALTSTIKRTIGGINGRMVMYGAESMEDNIKDLLASRRLTRLLLGVFATLALVLAAVGIYGVVSYTVTQATHDIGVRMALGADTRSVLAMVIGDALKMALIGIVIGVAGGFAATQAMKGLLFGVSAADPLTFAAVAVVIAGVTVLASYIPARRATQVDPTIALRVQ